MVLMVKKISSRFCDSSQLLQTLGAHRFGALNGQPQRSVPDQRREAAERSRHAEQNRVVAHFRHAVVLEQNARVGVHVGPGVLHLAEFGQDGRDHFVDLGNQLKTKVNR